MMRTRNIFAGAAIVALVSVGAGCGKIADKATEKVTKKAVEKTIEHKTGGKVDLDTDGDGGFKFKTKDGSKYEIGKNATLPDGWPKLLAVPKGFEVVQASNTKDGDTTIAVVAATGKGNSDKIYTTFKKRIEGAGYEIESESSTGSSSSGSMQRLSASDDGERLSVTVVFDPDEGQITLSMSASTVTDGD